MKIKQLQDPIQLCVKCGYFKPAKPDVDIEYCSRCGEKMLSECTYCEKPITDPNANYCERCGEKIKEKKNE